MKAVNLKIKTRKELAQFAKRVEVRGWHEMTKTQLLRSLRRRGLDSKSARKTTSKRPVAASKRPADRAKVAQAAAPRTIRKTASKRTPAHQSNGNSPRSAKAKTPSILEKLRKKSVKELLQVARKKDLASRHSMNKEQLVKALSKVVALEKLRKEKSRIKLLASRIPSAGAVRRVNGTTRSAKSRTGKFYAQGTKRNIATKMASAKITRSRIVTMVRDSYWLHVYWELTSKAVERTARALGRDWYVSKPILRLLDVTCEDGTSSSEAVVKDIEIHGGVSNWYIDVDAPTRRSYRVDIGYLTKNGRFLPLARSNVVSPPSPGKCEEFDEHWQSIQDESERIYALSGGAGPENEGDELINLFRERLRRPLNAGSLATYGPGALGKKRKREFHFELDAELIVFGSTDPEGKVTLQGEPVEVRPDGTFTLRFRLPDGRQIIPAVAQTRNGIEERTIILAIERNTKSMEPMFYDGQDR